MFSRNEMQRAPGLPFVTLPLGERVCQKRWRERRRCTIALASGPVFPSSFAVVRTEARGTRMQPIHVEPDMLCDVPPGELTTFSSVALCPDIVRYTHVLPLLRRAISLRNLWEMQPAVAAENIVCGTEHTLLLPGRLWSGEAGRCLGETMRLAAAKADVSCETL